MNYNKIVENGYITSIGVGAIGVEISEQEYNEISAVIATCPHEDGVSYKLRSDLTWEAVELPPTPEPDVSPEDIAEALGAIL